MGAGHVSVSAIQIISEDKLVDRLLFFKKNLRSEQEKTGPPLRSEKAVRAVSASRPGESWRGLNVWA